MGEPPAICDYEGSDYRTRFWGGGERSYEDRAERHALRRLLPPRGQTLIDIGAGFGRLADEYGGYGRVVLFDFSRSLLREAQAALGADPRFLFVAGNWYQMPFVAGLFDSLVQVRTIHHAADVPALFAQLARIAAPGAAYVLEFANKRHLKAIARYALGRQELSPYDPEPAEFAALNFDFHPRWMRRRLEEAGFRPGRTLAVSYFRHPFLKRFAPAALLAAADRLLQPTGRWAQLSPSVFMASLAPAEKEPAPAGAFFACPACGAALADSAPAPLACPTPACGRRWAAENRFYDFKQAV
jgi:ubiquinone/menaquinone biosynthesis C-methylase UbiE